MSPTVRQEKFRKAFSRTALGSEMSRNEVDWAWSLTNWPEGRSVDFIWRRSPGSMERVSSIWNAIVSSCSPTHGCRRDSLEETYPIRQIYFPLVRDKLQHPRMCHCIFIPIYELEEHWVRDV